VCVCVFGFMNHHRMLFFGIFSPTIDLFLDCLQCCAAPPDTHICLSTLLWHAPPPPPPPRYSSLHSNMSCSLSHTYFPTHVFFQSPPPTIEPLKVSCSLFCSQISKILPAMGVFGSHDHEASHPECCSHPKHV